MIWSQDLNDSSMKIWEDQSRLREELELGAYEDREKGNAVRGGRGRQAARRNLGFHLRVMWKPLVRDVRWESG